MDIQIKKWTATLFESQTTGRRENHSAVVSCSPNAYRLGGVKKGLGLTGKPGCAWVGAWVMHGWCLGE